MIEAEVNFYEMPYLLSGAFIMNKNWPTQDKDMHVARLIMEEYAHQQNIEALGLFELVVSHEEKRMNFRLSTWVLALAQYFNETYGAEQGELITRLVISRCLVQNHTIH